MRRDVPPYAGLTRICLAEQAERHGWQIGDHTYGNPKILEAGLGRLIIGKFCSIADVTIVLANHMTSAATTFPFDSFRFWWPAAADHSCHVGADVVIGSDVWLGEGSMLLPGADIGHGSIIGAGSVVRGSVPAYAIVTGNPAQVVRFRFEESLISGLLRTAWWDRPDEEINTLIPHLLSKDIGGLLARLDHRTAA